MLKAVETSKGDGCFIFSVVPDITGNIVRYAVYTYSTNSIITSDYKKFYKTWNSHCAGKKGKNFSKNVNFLTTFGIIL